MDIGKGRNFDEKPLESTTVLQAWVQILILLRGEGTVWNIPPVSYTYSDGVFLGIMLNKKLSASLISLLPFTSFKIKDVKEGNMC